VLSGGCIGQQGKDASVVGSEAAEELIANLAHEGCVDEYLQARKRCQDP
jgi:RNA 3'-terminal phosphate cyclase (ATP)